MQDTWPIVALLGAAGFIFGIIWLAILGRAAVPVITASCVVIFETIIGTTLVSIAAECLELY